MEIDEEQLIKIVKIEYATPSDVIEYKTAVILMLLGVGCCMLVCGICIAFGWRKYRKQKRRKHLYIDQSSNPTDVGIIDGYNKASMQDRLGRAYGKGDRNSIVTSMNSHGVEMKNKGESNDEFDDDSEI